MERQKVKSGFIKSVGYDPLTKVLEVEMANNDLYRYSDVPPEHYDQMMASESVGKYFAGAIRVAFKGKKVEK